MWKFKTDQIQHSAQLLGLIIHISLNFALALRPKPII